VTRWPLVGRSAPLRRVARALTRPGGLVVCGGAGTGKTRLLAAARDLVGDVWWATGAPGVPLGPFAPLLPRAADGAALPAQLSLAAAALVARGGAVAVDDAHRLDAASVALLAHLVANTTVPVVLTVRTTGPLPWLRDLDRVTLGPLTPAEVGEVLEQALDGPVETALAARLAELSGGNPLLLREIVDAAALHREQGVWRSNGPIVAANSLPAAIAARLDRLPPRIRATAELVALAEPVPAAVLDRLLDPAELAGLDEERLLESRSQQVRLVHPLYAESLRATVPPMRARDHYRRLAALPLPHLRVVGWQLDGGLPVGPASLLRAAREASDGLDHDLAARLARAAVDAGGGFEAKIALLAELPYEGRADEALALAADLAGTATSDAERVRVASARSNLDLVLGRVDSARSVLAAARSSAGEPALRIRLALQEAAQAFSTGHIGLSLDHGDDVLAVAPDDPAVLGRLAVSRVRALACAGRTRDAIELGERSLRALRSAGDVFGDALGTRTALVRMALLQAYAFDGQLERAREVGTDGLAEAAAVALRAYWAHELGQVAVLAGHATTAVRWLREAVALMPIAGLPASPHLWSLDALAEAYALLGDAEAAASTVERLRAVLPGGFVAPRTAGSVWAVAAGGETSRARDLAVERARVLEGVGSVLMAGWALHDAHRLGGTGLAAPLRRLADASQSPMLRAMAANADATATDSAARGLAALGCDLWAAETYVRAGHVHRSGGHVAPALASAAEADRLLARCGPVRLVPPPVADPLTGREREVVDLATRGHRDRDIAERLNLSVRTVQSHLYRAYRKLGVEGRRDLP
jgi:DNA-binding CsgD family transcriptional regulator